METARDQGLVRVVGLWGLAGSIVNAVVGAGIYALPAALADASGGYAPVALIACGLAVGAVAICFAEGGSRVATSGGVFGTIEEAFGPLAGFVAGMLMWFGNALGTGGVAAALADMIVGATAWNADFSRPAIIVGLIAVIVAFNIGGAARMARFVALTAMVKLLPITLFIVAGAAAVDPSNLRATGTPEPEGMGRAMILALFAFTGMEGALDVSGEVARPARIIPRALAISLVSVIALYMAVQFVAQGILGPSVAESSAPLADAMGTISPTLQLIILAGAGISIFGMMAGDNFGTPRVIFAFARHGYLPRVLGRVHSRTHAPHIAIVAYSTVPIAFGITGTFADLAVASTLTTIAIYIASCAAAWRLVRRGVARNGAPLNFRYLGLAATVGIVSMVGMLVMAATAELLGLAAAIAVSVALYFAAGRFSNGASKNSMMAPSGERTENNVNAP